MHSKIDMLASVSIQPITLVPQHVFFAFTPFNIIMAERVLEQPEFRSAPALLINTANVQHASECAQVINFSGGNHSLRKRLEIYRSIATLLTKLRQAKLILSVTAPHPHMILSNAAMLEAGDYPVNIYEDGMANYCGANNTNALKQKSYMKRLAAPYLGLRYLTYHGHISGIGVRIMDNGYFLDPEKIFLPHRFEHLHRLKVVNSGYKSELQIRNAVLVIDQDIESVFDTATSSKLRQCLAKYVSTLGMEVQLKMHPSQRVDSHQNWLGANALKIEGSVPAENIAAQLRPAYAVSFFSSALKNIKAANYGTRCVSFGASEYDELMGTNLREVLVSFGIELH